MTNIVELSILDDLKKKDAEIERIRAEIEKLRAAAKEAQVTFDATWSEADLLRIENKEQRQEIEKLKQFHIDVAFELRGAKDEIRLLRAALDRIQDAILDHLEDYRTPYRETLLV